MPLYLAPVSVGFPSPAEDYLDQALDLNELCIARPAALFYVRASGDSMRDAGIHSGDVLVVARTLEPQPGRIVIAAVNGELTVKRLRPAGRPTVPHARSPGLSAPGSPLRILV